MEKLLLIQVSDQNAQAIAKIAGNLKIKTEIIEKENWNKKLGILAGTIPEFLAENPQKMEKMAEQSTFPKESLLIMCQLTEKHVDKILAELRKEGIVIDYKAVLTETNQNWDVKSMYMEMFREKLAYMGIKL